MLNVFNVVSGIYDKYRPNDRKSFLNYSFVLKELLIVLGKVEYAKYLPQLKTHSKQKELERVWELITKDHEWALVHVQNFGVVGSHVPWGWRDSYGKTGNLDRVGDKSMFKMYKKAGVGRRVTFDNIFKSR